MLLESQLLALLDSDQHAMHILMPVAYRALVQVNTEAARRLMSEFFWIGTDRVSEQAAQGLWLAVLHSDQDVEFQQDALKKLQVAVQLGNAPKYQLAYLTDRIRRNLGRPQLFGVYPFIQKERDIFAPAEIEDEEHVEERWREYGLGPHLGAESFAHYCVQKLEQLIACLEAEATKAGPKKT